MAYNHKADLWSFGCVIFEICTLEKAFIGASAVTLISNILSSNLNSRWRWINRPEVHHKLLEVLTRYHLLDVNPSKRRSAKEMEVFFAHCLRVNNGNGEEILPMSIHQDGEDWNLQDQPTEIQYQANPDVPIDRPGDFSMYLGLNPAALNGHIPSPSEPSLPPCPNMRRNESGRIMQPVNTRPTFKLKNIF